MSQHVAQLHEKPSNLNRCFHLMHLTASAERGEDGKPLHDDNGKIKMRPNAICPEPSCDFESFVAPTDEPARSQYASLRDFQKAALYGRAIVYPFLSWVDIWRIAQYCELEQLPPTPDLFARSCTASNDWITLMHDITDRAASEHLACGKVAVASDSSKPGGNFSEGAAALRQLADERGLPAAVRKQAKVIPISAPHKTGQRL